MPLFSWTGGRRVLLVLCSLQFGIIFVYAMPFALAGLCSEGSCGGFIDKLADDSLLFPIMMGAAIGITGLFILGAFLRPQLAVIPIFLGSLWAYTDGLSSMNKLIAFTTALADEPVSPDFDLRLMIWPVFAVLISGWFALRQIGALVGAWRDRQDQHPPAGDS